jgi:serine/threonine protein phosphatase 1
MTHPPAIYAVGDIHGCYDQLLALMAQLPLRPGIDRLLFIGDAIDRGPRSYEVIEYLLEIRRTMPGSVFLMGNHERMLLNYLAGRERVFYLQNGGLQTVESYLRHDPASGDSPSIPAEHREYFDSLSLSFESESHIFVHAGMRPGVALAHQREEDLLWIRDAFIDSAADFGKPVVFGHTPFAEPLVQFNKIGIDTGAVYGNRLSCVRLPHLAFYQA